MPEPDASPRMQFLYERGRLCAVRCSCGWTAKGRTATACGMAWGAHANDEHPLDSPEAPR